MESGFTLLILILAGLFWLIPFMVILGSDKTSGKEKAAWVLAVIFISWFAWIFYLMLAPIKNKEE